MPMSTPTDVPFAVACDGTVHANVTRWEGVAAIDMLLHRANLEPGTLFIGVSLEPEELKALLGTIASAGSEAAAHICGARMWSRGPR
jgi:hypothetical protein